MTPIKDELEQIHMTQDALIRNKIDSLDRKKRLKINDVKETKIYVLIFVKMRNIWACCADALARGEK